MGVIYKATFSNGKCYIGQTSRTLEIRKQDHKNSYKRVDRNVPFYSAIRKYGWKDIIWEVIEEVPDNQLNEREIYWIDFYNSYGKDGYNATKGGESGTEQEFFTTKEEVEKLMEDFKKNGDLGELAKEYGRGYNLIRGIIQGELRSDLSGLCDRSFFEKYQKLGITYTNEQIEEIINLHNKGFTNPQIEKELNISIRYIQDVLSGRILSEKTGIPHITRKERQKYNPVNSKLTKDEVLDMIQMSKNGFTPRQIADKYNKNINRIYEILNGKTWGEVTGIEYTPKTKDGIRKFTSDDIFEILELHEQGLSNVEIANKKNTTPVYISNILSGRKWNNITHIKDNK